ncbi:MAG TPA: shikimate dehydrogenase [Myxococcales bacterium]|jgi:shikimate dehydrogenase|nr:shikimate dehydrogenase [Myxococcales bacterium]
MRKLFVLLGDPVAHSRSPAIHSRAFSLLGVDAAYAPCRVRSQDLEQAVDGLRALGADGFNVTVPHKTGVAQLVDRLHGAAARIGAVSCVARDGEALVGHNTDAPGLLRALAAKRVDNSGHAVVVGAGGSARAAAFALAGEGRGLTILNRTAEAAHALAQAVETMGARAHVAPLEGEEARRALREATLVVHCTTVGLHDEAAPFDVGLLSPGAAVADLVYAGASGETPLVKAARKRGLVAVDGIDVLVQQAIASLEIWLARPGLGDLAPSLREAALA